MAVADEKTYFGVLMNRRLIDNGIYLYKPEYLIEGKIYEEEGETYFLDDMGNEYLTIHDTETLSTDEETAVGYILSDDALTAKYPSLCMQDAKIEYFDEIRNFAHVGFYIAAEDKIAVTPFDFRTLAETLNGMTFDPDASVVQIPVTELQKDKPMYDEEHSKDKLDEMINEYGGQELIVMTPELFESLLNAKSYEEIKQKMQEIKADYEACQAYFADERNYSSSAKNNFESLLEKNVTGKHIIDLFEACYDKLLSIDNIETMKDIIKKIEDVYTDLSIKMDEKENSGHDVSIAQDYLYALVDKYDSLLSLDDLGQIKMGISKIKAEEEKNIKAIAKTYDDIDVPIIKEEKEKNTQIQEQIDVPKKKKNDDPLAFDYYEVYNKMVQSIIGRDKQIGSILTAIDKMDNSIGTGKRYSVLIAGTTGTGKTQTFNELKKAMPNRPIVIVDTNQLTQEGYVGGTIEKNILGSLLTEAHRINTSSKTGTNGGISQADLDLAERGIVVLDEIDKRAEKGTKDNVNGGAVIDQILKFMDFGNIYTAEVGKQGIPFDTSNVVVMASGAFQEYFDEKEAKKEKPSLGFAPSSKTNEDEDGFKKYNEVKPEDLVKYGLASQFIGRFQQVILYPPHTLESLIELENTEATSNIEAERKYFSSKGVELVIDEGFIEEAAAQAIKLKTGGRGLANIISRCVGDVGDEINKRPDDYKIIFLPKEAIEEPGKVILIKKDNDSILMKDVLAKNLEEAKKSRNLKKISFNTSALQEALKYKSKLLKEDSIGMDISKGKQKVKRLEQK